VTDTSAVLALAVLLAAGGFVAGVGARLLLIWLRTPSAI